MPPILRNMTQSLEEREKGTPFFIGTKSYNNISNSIKLVEIESNKMYSNYIQIYQQYYKMVLPCFAPCGRLHFLR